MLLGICSLAFFFTGISAIAALVAIITGHLSQSRIKQSAGTLTGRGKAITGLITGYSGLVVTILFVALLVSQIHRVREAAKAKGLPGKMSLKAPFGPAEVQKLERSAAVLAEAEKKLNERGNVVAFGNTNEAVFIARDYSEMMSSVLGHLKRLKLPETPEIEQVQLSAYCQLHADRIAFLVNVESTGPLREVTQKVLELFTWRASSVCLKENENTAESVLVGLRCKGEIVSILYGEHHAMYPSGSSERETLLSYFAVSDEDLMELPELQAPGEELNHYRDTVELPEDDGSIAVGTFDAPGPTGFRQTPKDFEPYPGYPRELYATSTVAYVFVPDRSLIGRDQSPSSLDCEPEGSKLAVGCKSGHIQLYDFKKPQTQGLNINADPSKSFVRISGICFSSDGKELFVIYGSGTCGRLKTWHERKV